MSEEARKQFEKETGNSIRYYPMIYANWLESKLKESNQQNKELKDKLKAVEEK